MSPLPSGVIAPAQLVPPPTSFPSGIFLRSTSEWWNKDVDGTPFTISAPTRQVDDTLFVFMVGSDQAAPTGWTKAAGFAPNFQISWFYRLADGTSTDDFESTGAPARNGLAQMAVFGNDTLFDGLLVNFQGGIAIDDFNHDVDFPIQLMFASTWVRPTLVLARYVRYKNSSPGADPTISPANVLANVISTQAVADPLGSFPSNIYVGWEWEYEGASSPLIAGNPLIGYSPIQNNANVFSQMQRYRFTL